MKMLNMKISMKAEVHNVSQCHQRRIETQPQTIHTNNLVKFGRVVFELCKHTDQQTYSSQYFTPLMGQINKLTAHCIL